jgi:hypothetical protein
VTYIAVFVVLLASVRSAHAAFDGSELEQTLGWLCVIPIGLFQVFVAIAAKKHVAGSPVARTLLATAISLVAALVVTIALTRERALVPALAIAMLGPGVPTFVSLVRARALAFALALLVLPSLPFILWFVDEVW